MIEFALPWVFVLAPFPLAFYWLLPRNKEKNQSLAVPFFDRAEEASTNSSAMPIGRNKLWKFLALGLIWLALLTSAAQPHRLGEVLALPTAGRDLMLAMDISGSMSTADMVVEGENISRLVIVKYILGEFLEKRKGDRVGLILFGTNAYLQAPLTFDLNTVKQFLDETTLRLAGERTAIGDAIGLAVKRLKDRPESQRVLILLTDGQNTAGNIDPRKSADLAAQAGVKIYTVGVGADVMRVSNGFFGGSRTVNPSSELDESTLSYIAEQTGGIYFRARDPKELLSIYDKLDALEEIEQEDANFRPLKSLYYYPLAIACIASLILYFIFLYPPTFFHTNSYAGRSADLDKVKSDD